MFLVNSGLSRYGLRIAVQEMLEGFEYSVLKKGCRCSLSQEGDAPFFKLAGKTLDEAIALADGELTSMGIALTDEELKVLGIVAPQM
jgi:hypothetical protein